VHRLRRERDGLAGTGERVGAFSRHMRRRIVAGTLEDVAAEGRQGRLDSRARRLHRLRLLLDGRLHVVGRTRTAQQERGLVAFRKLVEQLDEPRHGADAQEHHAAREWVERAGVADRLRAEGPCDHVHEAARRHARRLVDDDQTVELVRGSFRHRMGKA